MAPHLHGLANSPAPPLGMPPPLPHPTPPTRPRRSPLALTARRPWPRNACWARRRPTSRRNQSFETSHCDQVCLPCESGLLAHVVQGSASLLVNDTSGVQYKRWRRVHFCIAKSSLFSITTSLALCLRHCHKRSLPFLSSWAKGLISLLLDFVLAI